MSTTKPLVSVVIPTYNGSRLLLETLESVFAQTFTDYEIVVVDDGSKDDTVELLQPYVEAGRLRLVRQSNAGVGAARNRAFAEARGKYIAPLDHDDIWLPTKLEEQVRFFENHPQCVAVAVPFAKSTEPARMTVNLSAVCDKDGIVPRPLLAIANDEGIIMTSSLMIDREKAAGLQHDTRRDGIEDLPFQIQLFGRGAYGIAGDQILMIYRIFDGNYSTNAIRYYHGIRLLRQMHRANAFDGKPGVNREDLLAYLARIGRLGTVLLLLGRYRWRAARIYLIEAWHQFRQRQFGYVMATPFLLFAPQRVLRERWPTLRSK